MKSGKSGRLSKKGVPHASIRNTMKDIPDGKLSEMVSGERRDLTVFEIREELINGVLDRCYEIYIEKQTVLFTGYCAYLAWKQLFQWAFFPRDPGEIDYTDSSKWIPDKPPAPSPRDTWAGYAVPIIQKPKVEDKYASVNEKDLADPCEIYDEQAKTTAQKDTRNPRGSSASRDKRLPKEKSEIAFEEVLKKKKQKSTKSISSIQRDYDRSMFTKIKTMPYSSLPPAPPPHEVPLQEVLHTSQAIDETLPEQKLIDPTVVVPRKIQHEVNGPFRVPIVYQVLDEKDPCLDLEKTKRKSKRIIAKEIKKYSKPMCPDKIAEQTKKEAEEQSSNSSISSSEVKMVFDESLNKPEEFL